jgi:tRNA G26 N,N-dimethylase Trm1
MMTRKLPSEEICFRYTHEKESINPLISLESDKDTAPPSYFNLHRHNPKGQQLLRVDTMIQFLWKAGYRASRTHFDRGAVRTNASLSNLTAVLTQAANVS